MQPRVVVIGTGPAGCAAATVLARADVPVVLLGPSPDERWRVGESLPAAAQRLLRALGAASLACLLSPGEYIPCTGHASAWGEAAWRFRDALRDPEGPGWLVLRHRFDAAMLALATRAGVTHIDGQAVALAPAADGHRVRLQRGSVEEELSAPFLIDATGRAAWLVRKLGEPGVRAAELMAAVAWLRSPPSDHDQSTRVMSVPEGWWYSARLPQGLRVLAFHGLRHAVGEHVRTPASLLAEARRCGILPHASVDGELLATPQAHDAALRLQNRFAGHRWLAVGDAALALNPLASQGLLFALYSGLQGGRALLPAVVDGAVGPTWDSADYLARVRRVHQSNERALRGFAWAETRFPEAPFWRQHQRAVSPVL
ncbi:FAD-dependent monooxygenase [Ideonella sp. 4Y11]|uniref:FAD-dependent monooxygenase n=1 Tax=Ideonella aquatica TaxID=2824119 RepID=A0A940YHH1_9BURK|nr:tryptophan 7-halogenase [Ideonella aquatica]MBQ0960318.1 FAD-dependent monooxygenase [Ideonella aquatica]